MSKKAANSKPFSSFRGSKVWLSLKVLAALAGVALMSYGLLYTGRGVLEHPVFTLRTIHYQGIRHLETAALDELISATFPENILQIDLDRLRELVESENWVRSAVVRRRLPDQLHIQVEERRPIAVAAIANELKVVDPSGVLLDSFSSQYQEIDRPIVKGLKSLALENAKEENASRMALYLRVLRELDRSGQDLAGGISEIDVSDPKRVAIVPTRQGIPVFVGDRDFLQRYQAFLSELALVEQVRDQHGSIESVDVTYDRRIIVHTPPGSRSGNES